MEDVEALSTIVGILKQLDPEVQRRVLQSVHTFLGISLSDVAPSLSAGNDQISYNRTGPSEFSKDRTLSPKDFMRDKRPVTDVDRVVCLAYYLTNYLETRHFKTLDISALNTEAAQPKFSNASVAVDNATRDGYLVAATKSNKQLSAAGEKYVEMLPDREAAREAFRSVRPRRNGKKRKARNILGKKQNASKTDKAS